jgi:uncharacterized protein YodC (DUF2158 family)
MSFSVQQLARLLTGGPKMVKTDHRRKANGRLLTDCRW